MARRKKAITGLISELTAQINFAKDYLENRTMGLEPGIKALLLQQYSNPVIQKEAL